MTNQKGFTLIEMLIVLAVISTLLILLIPNLADKNSDLQNKGCDALILMAENQMQAYEIEKGIKPASISLLANEGYLKTDKCANETKIIQFSPTDNTVVEAVPFVDNTSAE